MCYYSLCVSKTDDTKPVSEQSRYKSVLQCRTQMTMADQSRMINDCLTTKQRNCTQK